MARKSRSDTSALDDEADDIIGKPKTNSAGIAAAEMLQFIERWESLEADKKAVATEQKELMAEAKGRGYDTKALKKIIQERAADSDKLAEFEAVLELYKSALGMD